jgi:uncharacterized protein (TIGR03435 family)
MAVAGNTLVEMRGKPEANAQCLLKTNPLCRFIIGIHLGINGLDLDRRFRIMMTIGLERQSTLRKPVLTALGMRIILGLVFFGAADAPLGAQTTTNTSQPFAVPAWQVAAGEKLSFEVATIRPNTSDESPKVNFTLGPGDVYAVTGGRFLASNISLLDYIRFAYKLTDGQTQILQTNAPTWVATKRFDIQAKSESPNPTKDQMRLMMQSLLADRFKLVVHTEMRHLPVLALVLAKQGKLGPQLRPHPLDDDTCSNVVARTDQRFETLPGREVATVCGGLVSAGVPSAPSHVRIVGRKVSMALIAAHLGEMGRFDRPVLDRTGLGETFDFVLEWGSDPAPDSTTPIDHDAPGTNLQEALQDQLGLKLERQKGPVEVLLVDHVDQPTEN